MAFVYPFVLLLSGSGVWVLVKHTEQTVIADNWMRIVMPTQTGYRLRKMATWKIGHKNIGTQPLYTRYTYIVTPRTSI